jgi:hypothetical protein
VKTLLRIGLVVMLCGLAMLYLMQRNWSLGLTRRQARLDKELRVLYEVRDSLRIEVARLGAYARLKTLEPDGPMASGPTGVSDGPVEVATGHAGGGR